jgi:hypothetical protein
MKKVIYVLFVLAIYASCQESDPSGDSEFTGKETTYALLAGSKYPVSGIATFKEKKDGSTLIDIAITGTEGDVEHPVHLHLGNTATADAEIAALLTPVIGKTGKSETHLKRLADESAITYQQLIELAASIKIHLAAAGPDKDVVLAAGNIGSCVDHSSSGRVAIGVCKSE